MIKPTSLGVLSIALDNNGNVIISEYKLRRLDNYPSTRCRLGYHGV